MTVPLRAPGHRAAHQEQVLVGAHRDDLEVARGHALGAQRPAMRLPLNTRPGYERLPIEPPWRKYSCVPCDAGKAAEVVALDDARGAAALA